MSYHDPLNTDERDWSAPEHSERKHSSCRECGEILAPAIHQWNGWFWCQKHYREITLLAMDQVTRELAGERSEDAPIYTKVRR